MVQKKTCIFFRVFARLKIIYLSYKKFVWFVTLCLVALSLFYSLIQSPFSHIEKQQGSTQVGWVHYISKEAGFAADFPTIPQEESKEMLIKKMDRSLNYQEYKSGADEEGIYSIDFIKLPRSWGFIRSKSLLNHALNVVLENEEGSELVKKEFLVYNGFSSLDFEFKQGGEKLNGRLILYKNTLFKLTIRSSSSLEINSSPFLNSFELISKK